MPKVEGTERAEAVEEVKMLTDGLTGGALISKLQQLAGGPNRKHAAVVTSSWGHARLGGGEDNDKLHAAIQVLAIEGARAAGEAASGGPCGRTPASSRRLSRDDGSRLPR